MSVNIDIAVEAEGWNKIAGAEAIARRAAAAALEDAGIRDGEVSIMLCDDARMRDLNHRFRQKDQPTNVLSFPSTEKDAGGGRFLGDVALAYETVTREAAGEGKSPDAHVAHLVVHGILHLLDFDHGNDADAEKMESRETKILAALGFPDPHAAHAEAQT